LISINLGGFQMMKYKQSRALLLCLLAAVATMGLFPAIAVQAALNRGVLFSDGTIIDGANHGNTDESGVDDE
jgi:hypothetical protein